MCKVYKVINKGHSAAACRATLILSVDAAGLFKHRLVVKDVCSAAVKGKGAAMLLLRTAININISARASNK